MDDFSCLADLQKNMNHTNIDEARKACEDWDISVKIVVRAYSSNIGKFKIPIKSTHETVTLP